MKRPYPILKPENFRRQIVDFLDQWPFLKPAGRITDLETWIKGQQFSRRWYGATRNEYFLPVKPSGLVLHDAIELQHPTADAERQFKRTQIQAYPECFIAVLRDARLRGEEGCVITRKNKVVDQVFHKFDTDRVRSGFREASPFSWRTDRIDKTVAVLAAPAGRNYYHFVFDILPRLYTIKDFRDVIDLYAVPSRLAPAQTEALSLLGVTPTLQLPVQPDSNFRVSTLIVPSLPGSEGSYSPFSLSYLRTEVRLLAEKAKGRGERIFVRRGRDAKRPIKNEAEVEAIARENGFESVSLEKASFLEQVAIFRDAKFVLGAHGAGFANAVFSNSASLLEIFSEDYIRPDCFYTLCCRLGFNYDYMLAKKSQGDAWGEGSVDLQDFRVKLTQFLAQ